MNRDNTVLILAAADGPWSEFADLLAERHGYRVLRASTESGAATIVRTGHVDLAIADDDQRQCNGWAACGCLILMSSGFWY